MACRATIQLKVHRQVVQSISLDEADIECLIQGLRLVTPCTQRIDRLVDLLEQIRDRGRQATEGQGDLAQAVRSACAIGPAMKLIPAVLGRRSFGCGCDASSGSLAKRRITP